MTIAFISDLHLEPVENNKTAGFFNFLNSAQNKYQQLYILGDFFEYWIGDGSIDETYGEPGVFQSGNILSSLWNSIRLGISAALFNGFIGLMVGYAVVRGRGTLLSKWLEGVAFAPYIFPSIAFGAIYISRVRNICKN